MKLSRNWLQTYVDLAGLPDDEISRAITFLGFEVEGISRTGLGKLDLVVVGEILTRARHPNADKLSVCTVDVGPAGGVKTIVCGAPNCDAGCRVPVALPGAILPGNFAIKQSAIRGQVSDGMMCAPDELGLGAEHAGLLILAGRPELGTSINEALPPGDTVFDVEITPNRPDCLGHLGIARELAAWFKKDLNYPVVSFTPAHADPAPRPDLLREVRVEAPDDCPLYTATVITGVKIGNSPAWLQDRLRSVGFKPINNVVDVGNFVMLEYNQPVHAFDARRLAGQAIVVRAATEGEPITTLDGKERVLTAKMLVIADSEKPVVIAGLMGGKDSGVSDATTDLVLEVACFRRQSVRQTSKRLALASDSSYRYERGIDLHSIPEATERCLDLILSTAGGTVAGPTIRVGGEAPWLREITVTPAFIDERLGFSIAPAEMLAALERLELETTHVAATETRGPAWTFGIPSWRDDLDRPIDLVEEVLRLHGSDQIPAAPVITPVLLAEDAPVVAFNRSCADRLVGQGFHECITYTLRSAGEVASWSSVAAAPPFALANPFQSDQSHLRPTMLAGLLESLKLNQSRGVAASRLFETGRVFLEHAGQVWECAAVGFLVCDRATDRAWLRRAPADFFTAKRLTETLAEIGGVDLARQPLSPVSAPASPDGAALGAGWQAGHSAVAGDLGRGGWVASFGLLDLALIKSLGVEGIVHGGIFAILPERFKAAGTRPKHSDFSLFPAAVRDLALVVDAAVPAAGMQKALAKAARAAAGEAFAVESVAVFDVYRGPGLPEGKKSMAFNLVFRSPTRTLTDDEVNAVFQKIQTTVTKEPGVTIRS